MKIYRHCGQSGRTGSEATAKASGPPQLTVSAQTVFPELLCLKTRVGDYS